MSGNIWVAAADGRLDIVEKLISLGENTANSRDPNGFTPIHAAASYGHINIIEYLINNGGDINIQDNDGDTPLHHCENLEIIKLLINKYNADYKIKNNEGLNVKEYFIDEGEFPDIIAFLQSLDGESGSNTNDNNTSVINQGQDRLVLPNGEEIKAFLSDNIDSVTGNIDDINDNTPEMIERRKEVERILSNTDLSEIERDEQLRNYVLNIVSSNMGKLRDDLSGGSVDNGDNSSNKRRH